MKAVLAFHPEQPGRVTIRFPYDPDVNARLKDHGGRWDPDARLWHVSKNSAPIVSAILTQEFGMKVVDDTAIVNQPKPPEAVVVDRASFYEAMFARLSEPDRKAKYRDLMRAFHPDAYGDPAEATAINVAYDRIRLRRGA